MSLEGQHLGEFEILERLGQGGMGAVYKARQTSLDRLVALKTVKASLAEDAGFIARFQREAKVAAKLHHPNLVQVISAGENEGLHWFAMEYVEGESAQARLRRTGRLEPREAVAIALHVATALEYAWRKEKLIHRDIKPDNIFLSADGEVKLGDLGLAKSMEQEQGLTTTGAAMGTPHYMAPEQAESSKGVDLRADIYSLGCTLYHLLYGRPPYTGTSPVAIVIKHVNAPVPELRTVWPECPAELSAAAGKMMRKLPAERPQNYSEVIADLQRAQEALSGLGTCDFTMEERYLEQRYRIIEPLGQTHIGRVFHAEDLRQRREVRLCVLHEEIADDSAACAALEQEVERLKFVAHANLLRVLAFETFEGATILATEWTNGFSLLELLRVRRQLRASEAILLLRQAAAGVDYAVEQGLTGSQFGLEQVLLDFAEPILKETLLRQAVSKWPAWTLKIHPLGWNGDLHGAETWTGNRTRAGGAAGTPEGVDAPGGQVRALASILYELLGGMVVPGMQGGAGLVASRYTPLSPLTEKGNEVLQRALDPATSFASAQEFCEALVLVQPAAARGGGGPGTIAATQQPAVGMPQVGITQVGTSLRDVRQPGRPGGASLPSPKSKWPLYAEIGAGLVVALVGAFFLFQLKNQKLPAATKDAPFVNTLGMEFVPVPGTRVLFSIWDTRTRDYTAYAQVHKVDGGWAMQEENGVPVSRGPDDPVVGVSWEDAQAFCQWLTAKESAEGKLPKGTSYRLPTDEEWSRAVGLATSFFPQLFLKPGAKSGKNSEGFPWGKEYPPTGRVGNYADEAFHAKFPHKPKGNWIEGYDDGYATTSPVGRFPANAYGLYDMGGNVWQWCEDLLDSAHKARVLRGASWLDNDRGLLQSSYRLSYGPHSRNSTSGFRCVVGVPAR